MRFENRTVLSDSDTVTHEALRVREKRVPVERRSVQFATNQLDVSGWKKPALSEYVTKVRNKFHLSPASNENGICLGIETVNAGPSTLKGVNLLQLQKISYRSAVRNT